MRVLALYLPQFHCFKENDEWWGKGYTEWTAVRGAKPVFEGHIQPRVPLGGRYYDLLKEGEETLRAQASLAREYGIYGFCIYRYWFCGKQLMERPARILLEHPDIDINYCICWANESWTRTWYGLENEVLMQQDYGSEADWEEHIDDLLDFFRDPRYIKIDSRPVLMIYRSYDIACLEGMRRVFDEKLRAAGFDGVYIISGNTAGVLDERDSLLDARYYFEPGFSLKHGLSFSERLRYNASVALRTAFNKVTGKGILERRVPMEWIYRSTEQRDYAENEMPGTLARWDNTPRRSYKGLVYTGADPGRFEKNLRILAEKVKDRANDFVVINAMNEWGEGAMLEPDEAEGYAYLEAVRRAALS